MDWELAIMGFLVVTWVVLTVWSIWSGYKSGRLKYTLKLALNGARPMASFIWMAYFMIFATSLIPAINDWVAETVALQTKPLGVLIISLAPMVYILTMFVIIYWVIDTSGHPIIKYTEQEQVWEKEAGERAKARVRKLMFWKHESVR